MNVVLLVPEIFKVMPDIWVTIIDDNSPDGTANIVKEMMVKYKRLNLIQKEKKEGLGKAYIYAFKKILSDSNVSNIITMDADLSHPVSCIPEMRKFSKEYDVVIGSRYIKGGKTEGWELWRRLLSMYGNIYCRTITRMPLNDCTAGFNLISTKFLRKIDFRLMDSSGYAFMMELKYLLFKLNAKFKEVPIVFKNRIGGESKITNHIIREGILAPWKMILK